MSEAKEEDLIHNLVRECLARDIFSACSVALIDIRREGSKIVGNGNQGQLMIGIHPEIVRAVAQKSFRMADIWLDVRKEEREREDNDG